MRAAVIYKGGDGWWVAEVPSLPGCITQGRTKPEVIQNIREAVDGWVETAQARGMPIPTEGFETQVVCV